MIAGDWRIERFHAGAPSGDRLLRATNARCARRRAWRTVRRWMGGRR